MLGRWGSAAAAMSAAAALALVSSVALADGMPPEYPDPGIQSRTPAPVVVAPAPVVTPPPAPLPVAPVDYGAVVPKDSGVFTVTFAEVVGYIARVGYEDVKRSASLYCAHYARVAVLDTRFRVEDDWYVRFKCMPPA